MDADTEEAPDPNQPLEPTDPDQPKPKPKGAFKTTKHSLVKRKIPRYFRCPVCYINKTTVLKLNTHFKLRHPPL